MELEKYITAAKNAIDKGYFGIQDALMKYDEALEELKKDGWKYSEKQHSELYQEIVATFNTETQSAISDCKTAVQKQKNAYMEEVSAYYVPDGSKIDMNDMNLIKSGLPMTVDEVLGMIEKHADNPTMLRIIEKFAVEQRMLDKIRDYNASHAITLVRAKNAGKTEEKIFDTFVHLAMMGMNHPDNTFTLYQARLDDYEEDTVLKLLKAKLFIDNATQQRINQIEQNQRDKKNDKTKGKSWGTDLRPTTTYTKIN
ncbi:MAG: hypothetical protein MR936_14965 [Eubacterium sp.]|nr:hypothetical protein [Eubacterium sp.]